MVFRSYDAHRIAVAWLLSVQLINVGSQKGSAVFEAMPEDSSCST